ncbi:zinc finger BED domain-containing protein 4-like [Portunus trituberculatus]|uniref:zinc finger BED domain-containing protein 4-like n=1 Tax=Portunus trituberculatus TaxID=210409 RepID=UPI001E1D160A|nr:zinc finger BED domain-containing protein 4-like [Portunus trituberculatus]
MFPVKKLIQDVETRWNSTYHMLERFVQQSNLVTTTLCLLGKNYLCLSNDGLSLIKKVILLLEYFDEATKEISEEKFTSLSKVLPIVRGLQDSLQVIDDDVDVQLCEELKKHLNRRFAAMEGIFYIGASTILDHRVKKLPFSDASNIKVTEEHLISILHSLNTNERSESSVAPSVLSLPESTIKSGKKSLWNTFDAKAEKISQTVSNPSSEAIIELRRYFEEPRISRIEDPLSWWKKKAPIFPNLSKVAKRILCVPATSVPSERLFSKAGELISQRQSTLKDKNVNMILFLNKNLK